MSKQYTEVLHKLLQNITGKTVTGQYKQLADLFDAYNDKYLCEVTFSTTPAGATIVVKDSAGNTIAAKEGKYYLNEGSYTYDVSAEGYSPKTNQSLVITNSDEQTGTKSVSVTLTTCVVTFSTTPSDATIVVKKGTTVIEANEDGTYNLPAGSYTYDASAEGYVSKVGESLTISAGDETTGTKTVTVTLTAEEADS